MAALLWRNLTDQKFDLSGLGAQVINIYKELFKCRIAKHPEALFSTFNMHMQIDTREAGREKGKDRRWESQHLLTSALEFSGLGWKQPSCPLLGPPLRLRIPSQHHPTGARTPAGSCCPFPPLSHNLHLEPQALGDEGISIPYLCDM